MRYIETATVLSIAGSDSSGGAGIQADIKAIEANGCYAMTAITALTAQNTTGVTGISAISPEFLKLQLDACFEDIRVDAVKIGMVAQKELIEIISLVLSEKKDLKIVVDPVMVSTSKCRLLEEDAIDTLKEKLIPLATLITPNIPEAEILTGIIIKDEADMVKAAKQIEEQYGVAVLIKGGHSINDANDILVKDGVVKVFEGKRIDNDNTHGTGCTLSSAIAAGLAKKMSIEESIKNAKDYISKALYHGINLGKGSGPLNHIWNRGRNRKYHKCLEQSLLLYGVTDGRTRDKERLCEMISQAARGGMTFLQLRLKDIEDSEYIDIACSVKKTADRYRLPFIINDNVYVAKMCNANGVHLGLDDMDISKARIILGDDCIIGATAHNVEEAVLAERLGADYIGAGAVFKTSTKDDTVPLSMDELKKICEAVSIPVVAIAGINEDNVGELRNTGISGVAVVSSIFGADNIENATRSLKIKTEKMLFDM